MRVRMGGLGIAVCAAAVAMGSLGFGQAVQAQEPDRAAAAVKGAEARDGLLRTFVDRKANKILVQLPAAGPDGVSGRFLYQASLASGMGSTPVGLDRAQSGSTQVVAFRRAGGR